MLHWYKCIQGRFNEDQMFYSFLKLFDGPSVVLEYNFFSKILKTRKIIMKTPIRSAAANTRQQKTSIL